MAYAVGRDDEAEELGKRLTTRIEKRDSVMCFMMLGNHYAQQADAGSTLASMVASECERQPAAPVGPLETAGVGKQLPVTAKRRKTLHTRDGERSLVLPAKTRPRRRKSLHDAEDDAAASAANPKNDAGNKTSPVMPAQKPARRRKTLDGGVTPKDVQQLHNPKKDVQQLQKARPMFLEPTKARKKGKRRRPMLAKQLQ